MCSKCDTGNWVTLPPQHQHCSRSFKCWERRRVFRDTQYLSARRPSLLTHKRVRWSWLNVKSPAQFPGKLFVSWFAFSASHWLILFVWAFWLVEFISMNFLTRSCISLQFSPKSNAPSCVSWQLQYILQRLTAVNTKITGLRSGSTKHWSQNPSDWLTAMLWCVAIDASCYSILVLISGQEKTLENVQNTLLFI